jgi:predicted NAD/FAD-binding protein
MILGRSFIKSNPIVISMASNVKWHALQIHFDHHSELWTPSLPRLERPLRLVPLFYKVKTNIVTQLFSNDEEQEISTLSCLKETYHFSDQMIQEFFEPFLTGIYFCPLQEQSSHIFHFVFKMFAEGSASL